jgi:lysophospholipase
MCTKPSPSSATFKLFYTLKHTTLFLDQVHGNTVSGFTPFTNVADAKFGSCMQCAAIDRARFALALAQNASIPILRSDMCRACFKQYCYDPANPPSKDALSNRREQFVDPDPQGIARVEGFLGRSKIGLIVGCVMLVLVMIGVAFGM